MYMKTKDVFHFNLIVIFFLFISDGAFLDKR